MAVSTKDQERLNGAQQSAVQNYTDQYYEAKARGDKAGMQAAHDAAERCPQSGRLFRRGRWERWLCAVAHGSGNGTGRAAVQRCEL